MTINLLNNWRISATGFRAWALYPPRPMPPLKVFDRLEIAFGIAAMMGHLAKADVPALDQISQRIRTLLEPVASDPRIVARAASIYFCGIALSPAGEQGRAFSAGPESLTAAGEFPTIAAAMEACHYEVAALNPLELEPWQLMPFLASMAESIAGSPKIAAGNG